METYTLGVHVALGRGHSPGGLAHHVRHAVHGVVGLDLGDAQLRHVGHLVHLLGESLLREQHLGLLIRLRGVALLQQVLDLLLEKRVLLRGLLRLSPCLLRLELYRRHGVLVY